MELLTFTGENLVAEFLQKYEGLRAKEWKKREAAAKKAAAAQNREQRQRLVPFVGEQQATLVIGQESIPLRFTITADKTGKIKLTATL